MPEIYRRIRPSGLVAGGSNYCVNDHFCDVNLNAKILVEVMRGLYNPIHSSQSLIMSWKLLDDKRKNKNRSVDLNNCDYGPSIKEFVPKQVHHRLNPDQIIELIETYQAGTLVKELAKNYQIDRRTVPAILKRQGVKKRSRPGQSTQHRRSSSSLYAWR